MNLKSENSAYIADHLEENCEIQDELADEIPEIADANVRRRMSEMRLRRRASAFEEQETILENEPALPKRTSVSNFSVRRSVAISLGDEELNIFERVLSKRAQQLEKNTAPIAPGTTAANVKKSNIKVQLSISVLL